MTLINVWYHTDTPSMDDTKEGYYWDDSEDHGGLDRISPVGPFSTVEAAMLHAKNCINGNIHFDVGVYPTHYSDILNEGES